MGITFKRLETKVSVQCWAILKTDDSWMEKIKNLEPGKLVLIYDEKESDTKIYVQRLDGKSDIPMYTFFLQNTILYQAYSDPFTIE